MNYAFRYFQEFKNKIQREIKACTFALFSLQYMRAQSYTKEQFIWCICTTFQQFSHIAL